MYAAAFLKLRMCEGTAFGIFAPSNPLRAAVFRVVEHPLFEALLIVVITANCILLALDDAAVEARPTLRNLVNHTDYAFSAFFALEMCMKLLAWGVWGCGQW